MIVGVTGWFAAGKDSVADYLIKKGFKYISLSDIIREELTKRGLEHSRDNLQRVGNELRNKFGANYLAAEAARRISSNPESDYVIPSVRQPAEYLELTKLDGFKLVEVYCHAKTRYQRLLSRARTKDEKNLSYNDFVKNEEREKSNDPNGQQLDKVIELADYKIVNQGTLQDLEKNVDKFLKESYGN